MPLLYNTNFISGPKIKVTSPDQFVPIFLAYFWPHIYPHGFDVKGMTFPFPYTGEGSEKLSKGTVSKAKAKKLFVKLFDVPYPEEYSLPMDTGKAGIPGYRSHIGTTNTGSWNHGFSGHNIYYTANSPVYNVLPGLVAISQDSLRVKPIKSELHLHGYTEYGRPKLFRDLDPALLILVKAKWIPVLRVTALAMQLGYSIPVNLPVGDYRVLRNPNSALVDYGNRMFRESGLAEQHKAEQFTVEPKTKEEITAYLINPAIKILDRDQILDRAGRYTTEQLKALPIFNYGENKR